MYFTLELPTQHVLLIQKNAKCGNSKFYSEARHGVGKENGLKDSFAIVTDSTSNIPYLYAERYDITVLPLKYLVEDKEYPGYDEQGNQTFQALYEQIRQGKTVTTSMVNETEAYEVLKQIMENGQDILYIGLSSKLSGTFEAVKSALLRLKGEYPERHVYAVDSLCVALGEGLLIYRAVKMRKQGKSIEKVYKWCSRVRWNVNTIFTVDDLQHLKRSGRASTVVAMVGTVLKIKLVLRMNQGGILKQETKVRGRKKSLDEMVKRTLRDIREPQTVFISHGDCVRDAKYVADQLRDSEKVSQIIMNTLDPVIGVHTGPDSIGIFFISY